MIGFICRVTSQSPYSAGFFPAFVTSVIRKAGEASENKVRKMSHQHLSAQ